jgi:hypothetical protein
MAGGGDRLSELSDDLLRHILHFAPVREAASTAALSRRDGARRCGYPWASAVIWQASTGSPWSPCRWRPSACWRLELTDCTQGLYQSKAAVVLPRLSCLRLRHCTQHLGSLQRVIDAAPTLATVCLESVVIGATNNTHRRHHVWSDQMVLPGRLRCPPCSCWTAARGRRTATSVATCTPVKRPSMGWRSMHPG